MARRIPRERDNELFKAMIREDDWNDILKIASRQPYLINFINQFGSTTLMVAIWRKCSEKVALALINLAEVETLKAVDDIGFHLLHYLSEHGYFNAITRSLERTGGHGVNWKSKDWSTPLHRCMINNSLEFLSRYKTIDVLMRYKADPSIKNKDNCTPKDLYRIGCDQKTDPQQMEIILNRLKGKRVPVEIIARGKKALEIYSEELKGGEITVKQGRVFFIGLERVGKTSTIKSLLQKRFDPNERITDAIVSASVCTTASDSHIWKEQQKDEVKTALEIRDNAIAGKVAQRLQSEKQSEPMNPESQTLTKEHSHEVGFNSHKLTSTNTTTSSEPKKKTQQPLLKRLAQFTKCKQSTPVTSCPESIIPKIEACLLDQQYNDGFTINMMDFGGQPIYHNIQRIYLVPNAVYCNVFNLSHDLDAPADLIDPTTNKKSKHRLTNLEVILCSIRSVYTNSKVNDQIDEDQPCPPIILIGTHLHSLGKTEEERTTKKNAQFAKIQEALKDKPYKGLVHSVYFAIDNREPSPETVADILHQISYFLEKMVRTIPINWLNVQNEIQAMKEQQITKTTDEMMALAEHFGVKGSAREVMYRYMHDVGEVLFFLDDNDLKNVVVLNPNDLVDISRTFITVIEPDLPSSLKPSWKNLDSGILEERLLVHLLSKFDKDVKFDLCVALLQKFGLICEKSTKNPEVGKRIFYVLSRLSPRFIKEVKEIDYAMDVSLYYDFCGYLPDDVFQRSATKFIERFERSGTRAPTLAYEYVGLHIANDLYVSLSVVTVKYRRMIKAKIMKVKDASNHGDLDPVICKEVKECLDSILGVFVQSGGRGVEVKVCIPCMQNSNSKDAHFHLVENFKKGLCGCMGEEVDRFYRLFGGKRGVLEDDMVLDISNEIGDGWRRLGSQLKVPWQKIRDIDSKYKYTDDAAMEMITTWKEQLPSDANQIQLMTAALEAKGYHDIARRLKRDKHKFSDGYLDDTVLLTVSERIGANLPLFVSLGFKWKECQNIAPDQRNMELLTEWRDRQQHDVNQCEELYKALKNNKLTALAEMLKEKLTTGMPCKPEGFVDDHALLIISKGLREDWSELATRLNFEWSQIQTIRREHETSYDRNMKMLCSWRDNLHPSVDQRQMLCTALSSIQRNDLVEDLKSYKTDKDCPVLESNT